MDITTTTSPQKEVLQKIWNVLQEYGDALALLGYGSFFEENKPFGEKSDLDLIAIRNVPFLAESHKMQLNEVDFDLHTVGPNNLLYNLACTNNNFAVHCGVETVFSNNGIDVDVIDLAISRGKYGTFPNSSERIFLKRTYYADSIRKISLTTDNINKEFLVNKVLEDLIGDWYNFNRIFYDKLTSRIDMILEHGDKYFFEKCTEFYSTNNLNRKTTILKDAVKHCLNYCGGYPFETWEICSKKPVILPTSKVKKKEKSSKTPEHIIFPPQQKFNKTFIKKYAKTVYWKEIKKVLKEHTCRDNIIGILLLDEGKDNILQFYVIGTNYLKKITRKNVKGAYIGTTLSCSPVKPNVLQVS